MVNEARIYLSEMKDVRLSPGDVVLLGWLRIAGGDAGVIKMPAEDIASALGVHTNTVFNRLKKLKAAGYLLVRRKGLGQPNQITLMGRGE